MKREPIKTVVLIIVLIAFIGAIHVQISKASKTLTVPDEYTTIGSAVAHASAGDRVFVKSGVYHENIVIDIPLTLIGENNLDTIIIGSGGSNPAAVVVLAADNIRISGFSIESQNYSKTASFAYGVWVEGNNCTIDGNVITNTYSGVFCSTQAYTVISSNTIEHSIKNGIVFYGGSNTEISGNRILANAVSGLEIGGYSNLISNNDLEGNLRAIGLGSSYSAVCGNNIHSNTESGIFLAGSKNIITENQISSNKYGVFVTSQLTAPMNNRIYRNNIVDNYQNAWDNSSALVEAWDNGKSSGGNYWSDYQIKNPNAVEVGSSGIGNSQYTINSNNRDNYPLMAQLSISNVTNFPRAISPPQAKTESVVASWTFDTVEASLISPDSTGNNPAILGSETPVYNNTPSLGPGKFGNALNFTGNVFATVQPSPSILTPNEVTIDAWVNIQAIKPNVVYQNIFIEAQRTPAKLPTRTLGIAVNGQAPQNATSPPVGALRGYVLTPTGFNEIDTTTALPFDTWVHVVFTRSADTGMHIFVNGEEQNFTIAAGGANPKGQIQTPTDIYIGHDSQTEIENLQISNTAVGQTQPIWTEWWLWTIIFAAAFVGALIIYRSKTKHK